MIVGGRTLYRSDFIVAFCAFCSADMVSVDKIISHSAFVRFHREYKKPIFYGSVESNNVQQYSVSVFFPVLVIENLFQ